MKLYSQTIHELKKGLAAGEFSSTDITLSVLKRIDQIEGKVGSYITLDRENALRGAEEADQAISAGENGALCGIPLALKDIVCTEGLRTTCGSKILDGFIPPYDATVVTRLKNAGAVILGKASMDEFAMGSSNETCAFGTPRNPWSLEHICGGSSGGSAAAVAADECIASIGSDTGGSIRQPASHCGVVGLKPTYGRISRYGLIAYASSLDQLGPFAKDVRDCALMLQVMSGYDERDSTSVNTPVPDYGNSLNKGVVGMKVGVPREYFVEGLDPEVDRAVREGIRLLAEAGAEIVDVSLPHTEYGVAAYYVIAPAEASSNLARYDGVRFGHRAADSGSLLEMYRRTRSEGFGGEVKRRIMIGTYALSAGYYDAYYRKALQVRTLIVEDFRRAFGQCDILVSPVAPTPAWRIGEKINDPLSMYLSDVLTIPSNLAGVPCMSLPCGFSRGGLPIGIQIQGPHFAEEKILQAAFRLEQDLGIAGRKATGI
ncbi:MAG: Asp-tRNA(Asn)/Glu-tRNA(Gln) amidotransferase subunit GatA [Proteobacteria bacterium]|nr:Asp-tRNA(Asn)/Glu-tRNA(Gln) amidotransferase subunit GatA [Pseudomonadota bacterium]MBU1737553.1 Asp-tRNA(Asn)/Glu-tRNA(Gln) amidotransferase subunit GatA [Pseudomonadota bacterium]